MAKYLLLALLALSVFSACRKEPVDANKIVVIALSTADYNAHYQDYSPHTNGDFFIWTESYVSFRLSLGITNALSVYGSFYLKQSDTIRTSGGAVIIDTIHFSASSSYYYYKSDYDSNFYGRDITLNLTPPTGQAPPFTVQMYMPKQIVAYMGKATLANATYYLDNQSDTLYWNADPNNKNGIDIGAATATNYNGQVVVSNKYISSVPDNGMYVLPKSFYAAFAPGTSVSFIVGRRTYTLVAYNQYKYLLDAYCYTPIFSWKVP